MGQRDPVAARRLSQQASAIARSVGPADMEMLGVALEGLAMVTEGDVAEGMSRLDEATAAATAGELTDPGDDRHRLLLPDPRLRAGARLRPRGAMVRAGAGVLPPLEVHPPLLRLPHSIRIPLTLRGEWAEAEREIEALRRHVERVQPRVVPIALIRLADLRRRQGRWEEADRLFSDSGSTTSPYWAAPHWRWTGASRPRRSTLAEEYLRRVPPDDRTERVSGLDILARARIAESQLDQARGSLAELRAIAEAVGTEPLQATVAYAEGCLLSASGDHGAPAPGSRRAPIFSSVTAPPSSPPGPAFSWPIPSWRSAAAIPRRSRSGPRAPCSSSWARRGTQPPQGC